MNGTSQNQAEANSLRQSRRELRFILLTWLGCGVWVIGYCYLKGYHLKPEEVSTVFGFPGWVFWGVALPWLVANAVTFWFCQRVLKNEEDEEVLE
mgnify:CR=1 FL=1